VTTTAIFRPEWPKRVLWVVVALMSGLAVVGFLSDPMLPDPAFWFFLVMYIAMAGVAARTLFIRLVVSERGVRVVATFSDHYFGWDSIARFEGPPQSKLAVLVTKTGERRRLAGFRQSPAEQLQNRPSHTERVVERLQAMLQEARRGADLS
jgi:hypothetical protein